MDYHDHHLHPLGYVAATTGLELMGASSLAQLMGMVEARAERPGALIGHRLNDEGLAERRLPTREDIDEVVPDRPVLLYRYCGHIAVANTRALELAGVDQSTSDPPGGTIDRDAAGLPTGVMRETAVPLVADPIAGLVAPPSDQEVLTALGSLADIGLHSMTGMVSTDQPLWCGVGDELETIVRLSPDLAVDIDLMVITEDPKDLSAARERIGRAAETVRFAGWKGFADGSLGGHTAALHEPYADRPDTRGTLRLDRSRALVMAEASLDLGGQVAIHAIGDRAIDEVLDLMEALIDRGAHPSDLRVEHASVMGSRAVDRFADLGVTASVQPAFLASESTWLPRRLGEDRMEMAYPFRSMREAGVPLLGGSDAPVEMPDPRVGIEAATDRHGINPDQALEPQEAERLFAPPG